MTYQIGRMNIDKMHQVEYLSFLDVGIMDWTPRRSDARSFESFGAADAVRKALVAMFPHSFSELYAPVVVGDFSRLVIENDRLSQRYK